MKEIWINLELYFKRYDFYNFRDFFWFNFDLNRLKWIKKKSKKWLIFRAGPAWMRRGTQGHVAAPCRPAQRLRGAIYILYLFI